jgi:hypothetical protein
MVTESRVRIVFAGILGCVLLFSLGVKAGGEQQLGRILYSSHTSVGGVPVPQSETILNGDVLTTSEDGSALVELKSGAKVKITKNSSVRFLRDGEKVQAELLSGAVVSESTGKPTIVVTTAKYQFEPWQEGDCRYLVRLSKEQETIAAAVKGNVLVNTHDSSGRYILPEGKYAAIPASSVGVPSQEKAGGEQAPAEQAPAEQAPAEQAPAGQAGTVTNAIPDEVVQRLGQGEEIPLKVGDGINWTDVVSTSKKGRVRIALLDGSFLNVGARSVMRIMGDDPQTQQTKIELTLGRMRAEAVEFTKPGAVFQVQTQTATIGVVAGVGAAVFLVQVDPKSTRVDCVKGTILVQNSNPTVVGKVRLLVGQFTNVPKGDNPTLPLEVPPAQLQSRLDQTDVGSATMRVAVPKGQEGATKAPWHIGSLSEGESMALIVGVAAGAVATIAIPGASKSAASPSAP